MKSKLCTCMNVSTYTHLSPTLAPWISPWKTQSAASKANRALKPTTASAYPCAA